MSRNNVIAAGVDPGVKVTAVVALQWDGGPVIHRYPHWVHDVSVHTVRKTLGAPPKAGKDAVRLAVQRAMVTPNERPWTLAKGEHLYDAAAVALVGSGWLEDI